MNFSKWCAEKGYKDPEIAAALSISLAHAGHIRRGTRKPSAWLIRTIEIWSERAVMLSDWVE